MKKLQVDNLLWRPSRALTHLWPGDIIPRNSRCASPVNEETVMKNGYWMPPTLISVNPQKGQTCYCFELIKVDIRMRRDSGELWRHHHDRKREVNPDVHHLLHDGVLGGGVSTVHQDVTRLGHVYVQELGLS